MPLTSLRLDTEDECFILDIERGALAAMPGLISLNLSNTAVTDEGMAALSSAGVCMARAATFGIEWTFSVLHMGASRHPIGSLIA